jgi:acyl-CoA synthetase (AMP-forming)/AMP-acid ligase II
VLSSFCEMFVQQNSGQTPATSQHNITRKGHIYLCCVCGYSEAMPSVTISNSPELSTFVVRTTTGATTSAVHLPGAEPLSVEPGSHRQAAPTILTPEQLLSLAQGCTHDSGMQHEQQALPTSTIPSPQQALPPLPFCYVIYTSGSTGVPSGVCGTEAGLLNRCQWMQQCTQYGLSPVGGGPQLFLAGI